MWAAMRENRQAACHRDIVGLWLSGDRNMIGQNGYLHVTPTLNVHERVLRRLRISEGFVCILFRHSIYKMGTMSAFNLEPNHRSKSCDRTA